MYTLYITPIITVSHYDMVCVLYLAGIFFHCRAITHRYTDFRASLDFIKCGMYHVFAQQVTYLYAIELTSVGVAHARPNYTLQCADLSSEVVKENGKV